jgi:hypothetical protein
VVKVHYDEGVAIHVGPEPCVIDREVKDEASAGERIGQPWSRESEVILGADAVGKAEGNTGRSGIASLCLARRGQRPWHVRTLLEREPGDLGIDLRVNAAGPHREGEEP